MRMFPWEGKQKNLAQDWIRKTKNNEEVNEQLWSFDRGKNKRSLNLLMSNAPINGLPQDGGAGQPTGNLTFSGFQMSISPPLGLHCKSNSHPWGPQTFIVS